MKINDAGDIPWERLHLPKLRLLTFTQISETMSSSAIVSIALVRCCTLVFFTTLEHKACPSLTTPAAMASAMNRPGNHPPCWIRTNDTTEWKDQDEIKHPPWCSNARMNWLRSFLSPFIGILEWTSGAGWPADTADRWNEVRKRLKCVNRVESELILQVPSEMDAKVTLSVCVCVCLFAACMGLRA